jgi:hypothetical protein
MENIELKIEGTKLILTVDLSKEIGPSSSGKNTLIASTEGNANVPGFEGVKVVSTSTRRRSPDRRRSLTPARTPTPPPEGR